MAQSLIAESEIDLHTVTWALESAGYTIAGVLKTRLTVEMLHTTKHPVIVLVNDQASQCMLVDVLSEGRSYVSSLSLQQTCGSSPTDDGWPASSTADERSRARRRGDVRALLSADLAAAAAALRRRSERPPHATLETAGVARSVARVMAALNYTHLPFSVAAAHVAALAILGGVCGYVLRSPWSLVLVPVAYVSGVLVRAARGRWRSALEARGGPVPAPHSHRS